MRNPSVVCVEDRLGSHAPSRSRDSDPAVAVAFRDLLGRCMCLQVEVSRLEEDTENGVYKFIDPTTMCQQLYGKLDSSASSLRSHLT